MAKYMQGVNGVLVLNWGSAEPGHEEAAVSALESLLQHLTQRKDVGDPRFFVDTSGNSDQNTGMVLVEGHAEPLFGILFDHEFQARLVEAASLARNFTTRVLVAGPQAEQARAVYKKGV